jgi:hypothetical protein
MFAHVYALTFLDSDAGGDGVFLCVTTPPNASTGPFSDVVCMTGDLFVPRATFLVGELGVTGVCVVAKREMISLNFFSILSLIMFISIQTAKMSADSLETELVTVLMLSSILCCFVVNASL